MGSVDGNEGQFCPDQSVTQAGNKQDSDGEVRESVCVDEVTSITGPLVVDDDDDLARADLILLLLALIERPKSPRPHRAQSSVENPGEKSNKAALHHIEWGD